MNNQRKQIDKKITNIGEALYIFLTGYSSGGKYSLSIWLEAKDIVKSNGAAVERIFKNIHSKAKDDIII